jgi:glycosyltransferase involved in cell wall biosynthesis
MKILFDHNEPYSLAHGGFQILINETGSALRAQGVEVEYLRWWDSEQRGDVIHYFGRANPIHIRFAHAKGMKYVMHELLTSQGSRTACRLRMQGLVNRFFAKVLPSSFRLPLRWDSYQLADAVIASTEWEAWMMRTLFKVDPSRLHVVPTGVHEDFFSKKYKLTASPSTPPSGKIPFLVTLATITERKRVAETAEGAMAAGARLIVIGKPYSQNDPYYQKFLHIVKRSNGLILHKPDLTTPAEIAPILQQAKGFILLSTMETQSTAAMAAAAADCPLLLSDLPWARYTFGDQASYVTHFSPDAIASSIQQFMSQRAISPPPVSCWLDVVLRLRDIYNA